eukprot:gene15622-biopygen8804
MPADRCGRAPVRHRAPPRGHPAAGGGMFGGCLGEARRTAATRTRPQRGAGDGHPRRAQRGGRARRGQHKEGRGGVGMGDAHGDWSGGCAWRLLNGGCARRLWDPIERRRDASALARGHDAPAVPAVWSEKVRAGVTQECSLASSKAFGHWHWGSLTWGANERVVQTERACHVHIGIIE